VANLLNIAALSRRTGVAPDTLRKWEQRYGVIRPARTAGGQRRYSEHDLARVEWLRDRLGEGWRISEAARVLEGAEAPPYAGPADLRRALSESVRESRPVEIGALLDQTFAVLPLERALTEVVAPVLAWVGDAWSTGELTVAQEHAASAKVRARLDRMLADARGGVRGTAVLACAPGELHDLGLLMLAVLLRADGWCVEFLGASTPVEQAFAFTQEIDAAVRGWSAARRETLDALSDGLHALGQPSAAAIVTGGHAVAPADASALGTIYPNGDLQQAVTNLRGLATA
jgi:MerR family transcriptional regulator, light-induced transcriptional regulator